MRKDIVAAFARTREAASPAFWRTRLHLLFARTREAASPAFWRTRLHLLLAGVGQVVEIHVLAVAIDPGGDEPEAVEACPRCPVPGAEVKRDRFVIELHHDL